MKRRTWTRAVIQVCVALFFLFCVILPILRMLARITPEGFRTMVSSPQFLPAVRHSVTTGLTATVLTLVLAFAAAWCLERVPIRGKAVFSTLFVLPMLIPSISHAFGLVTLFGANGFLTNLLGLRGSIYGFWGIVAGSVMYSFPVAFLMFAGILQYEDGTQYQAATVLGIPKLRQFTGITLPYMKKTLLSAFFAVFTMIVTDYGVPLTVGGKVRTLSTLMYTEAAAKTNYDGGSVIGAFLLLPAIVAFVIDLLNPERGQGAYVSDPVSPSGGAFAKVAAYAYSVCVGLAVLLPVGAFGLIMFERKYPVDPSFTMEHIRTSLNRGAGTYLLHSLLYALLAGVFGTLLAFVCAYLTARAKGAFSKVIHLISITSMSIPGLVLGLSYVIFFHSSPIYGTVLLIALANSMHFFASPYLMMYQTLGKVNPDLEDVGLTLGVGRLHVVKDVILPKVRFTMLEMFTYFFVNSMMTISAVSFLAPPSPKPVALMLSQFSDQLLTEQAAFVSLLILGVNLALKVVGNLLRRRARA